MDIVYKFLVAVRLKRETVVRTTNVRLVATTYRLGDAASTSAPQAQKVDTLIVRAQKILPPPSSTNDENSDIKK